MFKRNAKAWMAGITGPVVLIVLATVEGLFGFTIPGLEGMVAYGVSAVATAALTWLVPNG